MKYRSVVRTQVSVLTVLASFAVGARAGEALDASLQRAFGVWASDEANIEQFEAAPHGPGADAPWLVPGGSPGALTAHVLSNTLTHGALRVRAGFGWRDDGERRWSLDGSTVAWNFGQSELYASVERRHWGPGWMGSLILDGAAPALPAVGWRRSELSASDSSWLRWAGPWTADLFLARLRGHSDPARPMLVGMRVQFEPNARWQVGLSRTMQWGGAGRDESLRAFLSGLVGIDNVGDGGVSRANEPGNQLAGFDWRWAPLSREGPSFYGQAVGEDEAGFFPSKKMLLLGVDWPHRLAGGGNARLFVEAVNTIAGGIGGNAAPGAAYRHHVFAQGYTSEGIVLGHPAGGDMKLATAGALVQRGPLGAMLALSYGSAQPTSQRFTPGRVAGFNMASHYDVNARERVGLGLWWWQDGAGPQGAAQIWWQHRVR